MRVAQLARPCTRGHCLLPSRHARRLGRAPRAVRHHTALGGESEMKKRTAQLELCSSPPPVPTEHCLSPSLRCIGQPSSAVGSRAVCQVACPMSRARSEKTYNLSDIRREKAKSKNSPPSPPSAAEEFSLQGDRRAVPADAGDADARRLSYFRSGRGARWGVSRVSPPPSGRSMRCEQVARHIVTKCPKFARERRYAITPDTIQSAPSYTCFIC